MQLGLIWYFLLDNFEVISRVINIMQIPDRIVEIDTARERIRIT